MVDQPVASRRDPAHVVDLFAGPGGLDVAAHWLGLHVDGIEWDPAARKTRKAANLPTAPTGDVRELSPGHYPSAGILAGGPPCQTYTVAGSGAGRKALDQVKKFAMRMEYDECGVGEDLRSLADERTALVLEPLRWILEADRDGDPFHTIVLEQVPTVRPVWKEYHGILKRLGYSADYDVLNTEQFGVPQTRRRAILIASRDRHVTLPQPTHARYRKGVPSSDLPAGGLEPWVSMGQALRKRSRPFEVISNYGTGGDPKKRGRRDSSMPAATVTGKILRNRVFEGGQEAKRFDVHEAGRLQTFPLDYPWQGKDQAQQVGNAIPPRLAVHVLAAALGFKVDDEVLDATVDGEWKRTSKEKPLANELPITHNTPGRVGNDAYTQDVSAEPVTMPS
ncbi:DNA cytosine methyltransferase [Saccharopolyspora sp. SCSIO 74807]|uniref:DNA cytosine methyltransferase n=1 Tax=Saccharopolyspora sp. SCSIO 74807 TaxID=3118084 RepID=UPI0030CE31B4